MCIHDILLHRNKFLLRLLYSFSPGVCWLTKEKEVKSTYILSMEKANKEEKNTLFCSCMSIIVACCVVLMYTQTENEQREREREKQEENEECHATNLYTSRDHWQQFTSLIAPLDFFSQLSVQACWSKVVSSEVALEEERASDLFTSTNSLATNDKLGADKVGKHISLWSFVLTSCVSCRYLKTLCFILRQCHRHIVTLSHNQSSQSTNQLNFYH